MGKVTKKEMPMWAKTGHAKPVTRRDFLAHGLIPFAASALVPGALGLLTAPFGASANAATCESGGGILPSFVTVNLSGGAGLAGNFIPRDKGGQLLPSYGKIGGGTSANISLAPDLAVNGQGPFGANTAGGGGVSTFLAGLRAGAPTALANTSVVAVCVQSRDDSAENFFDASGMVYRAGLVGSMLPNMGTVKTPSGLSMKSAFLSPPSPLVVGSVVDIANSIGYTASLRNLSVDQKTKISRLVANLSSEQAKKFASISSVEEVKNLVECAGIKNQALIAANGAPTVSAGVMTAWGVNANTNDRDQNKIFANMIFNSLEGNGGVVNLQLGGYDYHDGSRNTGDTKDQAAGQVVGRILESAKAQNKKIFVYVTSDGATTSAESATPGSSWVSDRGSGGLALFFMYDPAGRPATNGLQIGSYTAGQIADDSTFVGNDPAQAAQVVFANYLKFSKRMDLFAKVFPGNVQLSGALLDSLLRV